jgi:hypothetical protein
MELISWYWRIWDMLEQLVYWYWACGTCCLACPKIFIIMVRTLKNIQNFWVSWYRLCQHVPNDSVIWYQLFNISNNTEEFGILLRISTMWLKNLGHIEELEPQYWIIWMLMSFYHNSQEFWTWYWTFHYHGAKWWNHSTMCWSVDFKTAALGLWYWRCCCVRTMVLKH